MVVSFDESHLDVRDGGKVKDDCEVILGKMTLAHPIYCYFYY